jgi:hypothetical protein
LRRIEQIREIRERGRIGAALGHAPIGTRQLIAWRAKRTHAAAPNDRNVSSVSIGNGLAVRGRLEERPLVPTAVDGLAERSVGAFAAVDDCAVFERGAVDVFVPAVLLCGEAALL